MKPFTVEDLDALAAEFGVDVTANGTTVQGIVDSPDEEVLPGQGARFRLPLMRVRIRTGALPGLAVADAITVDGADYFVHELARIQDGSFTELYLDTVDG